MNTSPIIFDRIALKRQRDRAAHTLAKADFLFREVADRLADRLNDISRPFPVAVDIGSHGGLLRKTLKAHGHIERLLETDFSEHQVKLGVCENNSAMRIVADEEYLPLAPNKFDLVMSNMVLHWVNDLPGTLIQIHQTLKPDGLFIGSMFGLGTLRELRQCLLDAETGIIGGAAAHVSPFAEVRDVGALLQRAGFALPVVDADTITVRYSNPLKLLKDIRQMGEANILTERNKVPLRRDVLMHAMNLYVERYADQDGRVPATFEIIFLHGWHPDDSQQKPLQPGSGKTSLGRFLSDDHQ